MFGNIGFMGIPIVAAVFPEQGMLYIALFTVVDQLLLWTVGVNLTAPTDKENAMSIASRLLKMINPATIAVTWPSSASLWMPICRRPSMSH